MAVFAHTTTRYVFWSSIVFLLHFMGVLTFFPFFIVTLLLIWTNYYFEKTGQEKEFENTLVDWLWLPVLVVTMVFVVSYYVF